MSLYRIPINVIISSNTFSSQSRVFIIAQNSFIIYPLANSKATSIYFYDFSCFVRQYSGSWTVICIGLLWLLKQVPQMKNLKQWQSIVNSAGYKSDIIVLVVSTHSGAVKKGSVPFVSL
jgi:hypothetical protein